MAPFFGVYIRKEFNNTVVLLWSDLNIQGKYSTASVIASDI